MGSHSVGRGTGRWLPVLGVVAALAVVSLVLRFVQPADEPGPQRSGAAPSPSAAAGGSRPHSSPSSAPPPVVTLAFAGDVHFTGRTEGLLDDPATAFGAIGATLSAADVAMVNLESAITERGVSEPKEFHFRTTPTALAALAQAGVDVASMANNHAVDYGPVGLEDTLAAVADGPVHVVGIGASAARAYAPYRTVIHGVGISIFGVSQVTDHTYQAWTATATTPGIASTADRQRLLDAIRVVAASDVVVVYIHWGVEGDPCPTADMADLAADLAGAGADVIVGTHAHTLLGAGYQAAGAYVSYGLGNFLWWRSRASSDDTGVLTVTVRDGAVSGARFTPALIDDAGRPQPVTGPETAEKLAAYDELRDCTALRAGP